jgi:anti-sigma factor RsiW
MTCEQLQEYMADYLAGSLNPDAAVDFDAHLEHCAACKAEAATLSETWRMLGLIEQEQPSPAVRTRFYDSLEAYRQGAASAIPAPQPRRLAGNPLRWWNAFPAFQVAWSAALLLTGIVAGQWLINRDRGAPDLARLQDEVQHMRQLVTLSLLQQQSASERLRGVDYANHVEQSDTQVLAALLHAVGHDPNVNVRLAAVDALRKFAGAQPDRHNLHEALATQDSPLVQIALIDLIVDMHDKGAVPSLEALERSPVVNKDVRQRVAWSLSRLQ